MNSPDLASVILNKHLPYLPLWTSFLSPTRKQVSDAIVENLFRNLKHEWMNNETHAMPERRFGSKSGLRNSQKFRIL